MLDVVDLAFEGVLRKGSRQQFAHALPLASIAQPLKEQSGLRSSASKVGDLAPKIGAAVLIKCEMIDISEADAGFAETVCNRKRRETRPMFDPAKALLFHGCDQLAVANDASRAVAVESIQAKNDHGAI